MLYKQKLQKRRDLSILRIFITHYKKYASFFFQRSVLLHITRGSRLLLFPQPLVRRQSLINIILLRPEREQEPHS